MNTIKEFTEKNREAWNEATDYHQKARGDILDKKLEDKNFVYQDEIELEALTRIGIKYKDIIHLCCNNGIELLSLKRLGAARCTGIDISDKAIEEASERDERFNIGCEFIRMDVYDIPEEYFGKYDIVYMTIGGLYWLPDLKRLFILIKNLLREGGRFFIYDTHPFALVFDDEGSNDEYNVGYSYFDKKPQVEYDGIDYVGRTVYEAKPCIGFMHKMSDIMGGLLIDNKFELEFFGEYKDNLDSGRDIPEEPKIPSSYLLICRKK